MPSHVHTYDIIDAAGAHSDEIAQMIGDDSVKLVNERCTKNPDVQICAADGLSSAAIEANLDKILSFFLNS